MDYVSDSMSRVRSLFTVAKCFATKGVEKDDREAQLRPWPTKWARKSRKRFVPKRHREEPNDYGCIVIAAACHFCPVNA
jgi:hypothetical protein